MGLIWQYHSILVMRLAFAQHTFAYRLSAAILRRAYSKFIVVKSVELLEPVPDGSWGGQSFCPRVVGVHFAECSQGPPMCRRCGFPFRATLPFGHLSEPLPDIRKKVTFSGVIFPQPPSYIFCVYQKDPSYTNYDNPLRGIDRIARLLGLITLRSMTNSVLTEMFSTTLVIPMLPA